MVVNNRWLKRIVPWLIPLGFLVIWQLSVSFHWLSDSMIRNLSSPLNIYLAGVQLAQSGQLSTNVLISAQRAIVGLLVGGSIGFIFGLLTGIFSWVRLFLDSTLQMLRTIPHLALIPLVILWFGIDESAKIFLIALGTFFPIYLNTYHGIKHIDNALIEMGKSYGLSSWAMFIHIILPGAMPSILVGLRLSLGIMWLTLIVAETIAANSGIGYLAMNAREFFQTDLILFSILLYAFLGILSEYLSRRLEIRLLRWHPNYQKGSTRG